jgi:hypothetical protein
MGARRRRRRADAALPSVRLQIRVGPSARHLSGETRRAANPMGPVLPGREDADRPQSQANATKRGVEWLPCETLTGIVT